MLIKRKDVFYSKQNCKGPFQYTEKVSVFLVQAFYAIKHYYNDACNNEQQQGHIKNLTCCGIRFINRIMKLISPRPGFASSHESIKVGNNFKQQSPEVLSKYYLLNNLLKAEESDTTGAHQDCCRRLSKNY